MRISDWSSDVCSSDLGKLEKSSGLAALSATISTASEIMMLVMKPMSRTMAGIGTTMNITSISVAIGNIAPLAAPIHNRSEEHTSELQSLMRISYAVFCLKKKNKTLTNRKVNHKAVTP